MKEYRSPLLDREAVLVPLPESQQLTEKTLVELERQIAKSVKENEYVLSQSELFAALAPLG